MVDFASDSDPPTATQPGFWGLAELSDASPLFTGCQVRSSRTGHLSYGSHYGARYTAATWQAGRAAGGQPWRQEDEKEW